MKFAVLVLVFVILVIYKLTEARHLSRAKRHAGTFWEFTGYDRVPGVFYPGDWYPYYDKGAAYSILRPVMPALRGGRIEPPPQFVPFSFSPVLQSQPISTAARDYSGITNGGNPWASSGQLKGTVGSSRGFEYGGTYTHIDPLRREYFNTTLGGIKGQTTRGGTFNGK